ncbi:hypothetical protein [Streptomyces sp. NPDC058486]|uniref:hypothetical protein n=1 Tax=unclassified Streptomyces TaxID=2593676 RepID=UPI0036466423
MGPSLEAEFIACTWDDMDAFWTAGCLAGAACLTPAQRAQAASVSTYAGHTPTDARHYSSSTSPLTSPPTSVQPRRLSTTANGPRARATSRRSSPSSAAHLDVLWALIRGQRTIDVLPPQRGLVVG